MPWVEVDRENFIKKNPHLAEFQDFLDHFNKETDRGAALVAAALLDELLARIIRAFLVDNKSATALLDGMNAPLGTFSSRIAAAFALGLLSKEEHADCDIIRKIRNEFAHRMQIGFADARIVGLCSSLHHSAKPYGTVQVSVRGQFSSGAVGLIMNLTNRAHYVQERRLKPGEWPI